jgi:hypothetical protein
MIPSFNKNKEGILLLNLSCIKEQKNSIVKEVFLHFPKIKDLHEDYYNNATLLDNTLEQLLLLYPKINKNYIKLLESSITNYSLLGTTIKLQIFDNKWIICCYTTLSENVDFEYELNSFDFKYKFLCNCFNSLLSSTDSEFTSQLKNDSKIFTYPLLFDNGELLFYNKQKNKNLIFLLNNFNKRIFYFYT